MRFEPDRRSEILDSMASTLRVESLISNPDGRIARGLRTRESILRAYEGLIAEASAPPTGAELAERAGVSARSIFTHFGDMDGVLAAAARRAFDWLVATHVDVSPDLPLAERLRRFALRQAEVLERTSPLYRMLRSCRLGGRREDYSPAVREILAGVDQIRRRYVAFVFGREIDAVGAAERDAVLEAFVVAASWNTWEGLRVEQRLDPARARAAMERMLWGLLRG
jgi:AcrR family transcriptional regulator